MALVLDYGETLVSGEGAEALTQAARETLGNPIRKADLYDLEQQLQDEVADEWLANLLNWDIPVRELLTDHFLREIHRRLYAPIWCFWPRRPVGSHCWATTGKLTEGPVSGCSASTT